jgi:hypothetical protein
MFPTAQTTQTGCYTLYPNTEFEVAYCLCDNGDFCNSKPLSQQLIDDKSTVGAPGNPNAATFSVGAQPINLARAAVANTQHLVIIDNFSLLQTLSITGTTSTSK